MTSQNDAQDNAQSNAQDNAYTHAPKPDSDPAARPDLAGEASEAQGEDAQGDAARAETGVPDRVIELEAENSELRDRMLRAVAEMENLRRRTERELKEAKAYSIASFARDMLVATDNLSRALMVVPAQAREGAEGTLKSLIEGIDMTEREMQRLLQKHGVNPIAAEGQRFDPHKHQAMFEVPDDSVPEGTVVQVMQEGYAIGERVLRPAMVGVSKGGPKRAQPGEAQAAALDEPEGPEQGEGVDKSA